MAGRPGRVPGGLLHQHGALHAPVGRKDQHHREQSPGVGGSAEEGPRGSGLATSQFSYGQLANHSRAGELLPVPGGYSRGGELTRDAGEIFEGGAVLPMGYWKGSGLSILLDLFAALLSAGGSVKQVKGFWNDQGISQLFLCFDGAAVDQAMADEIVAFACSAEPVEQGGRIFYPGERTLLRRRENLEKGIPVDEEIWSQVQAMER